MKATNKQIIAYKTSLDKIYKRCQELGDKRTKKEIEAEIKLNAGFEFESVKDERVTTDDLANLTIWCDLYGDQYGLYNCFPDQEMDGDKF